MYGVSPAFVLSGRGENFSSEDFCACLERIASLGFDAFQPELFHAERLPEWLNGGARRVAARSRALGLTASQFVAHFMMPRFASAAALRSDEGREELKKVAELAACFEGCRIITLPIGPWQYAPHLGEEASAQPELSGRFHDKLAGLLEIAAAAGFYLALEILPYSFLAGSEGFLRLHHALGSERLGLNLDTGHLWACKEPLPLLPERLTGLIFGTHLCDNGGGENLSLAPGRGSIDWPALLGALKRSGYTGSLDLEIRCPPEELESAYSAGLSSLKALDV
jgi:sugar phosphate isomerase/epimerase